MTGPGGTYRDGEPSWPEAVGDSAISAGPAVLSDGQAASANGPGRPEDPKTSRRRSRSRRRLRSRRRSRSSRLWRAVFFALALTGIVAGATWALLGHQLLVVRSIVVTGTRLVPRSEVLAAAGIQPGTPLIRVNTAAAAARVATIRQVASVQVSRSWPDRVVIAVRERTPGLAVAAPGGGYDLVDADGVIVQWAARRPPDLALYLTTVAVTSLRGDPDVAAVAAVIGELPARLRASVTSVTTPSPGQVTLRLAGGVTVLWGGPDHPQAKAEELALLMSRHARYYDVSAPGTAVTN